MNSVYFTFDCFKSLLSHHIGILNRFDKQRKSKFSILFFPLKELDTQAVIRAMQKILRESDAIFEHQSGYYFLLPNTDFEGAMCVLNQFEEYFGERLDEVILTYPDDGNDAELLLKKLHDYAKNWCNSELVFKGLEI